MRGIFFYLIPSYHLAEVGLGAVGGTPVSLPSPLVVLEAAAAAVGGTFPGGVGVAWAGPAGFSSLPFSGGTGMAEDAAV